MDATVTCLSGWNTVMNLARYTVNKPTKDGEPSEKFKTAMIQAEHGPLRGLIYLVELHDIPYFVSVHLVRHKVGVDPFVGTQRTDRTGIPRNKKPQDAPVSMALLINAQALLTISRRRLCGKADPETRKVWRLVVESLAKIDPLLASYCVPMCQYRGGICHEHTSCGISPHYTE